MTTGTIRRQMLNGLLVVELARSVRAAYCGRLLADCGAEVIKVELPAGAPAIDAGERAWLDAGKQSAALDRRGGPTVELLRRLLARADVLIEDQEPGTLAAAGLSAAALRAANPRLVHTTVTDFGSDGPWARRPTTDLIVSALSGMASLNNMAGGVPLRQPGDQALLIGAMFGYIGTLAALINRGVTGTGQRVDISAMEAVASVLTPQYLHFSYKREPYAQRRPDAEALLRCKDGWLSLTPYPDRAWESLTAIFGLTIDPADERFVSEPARRANAAAVRELLAPALMTRTRREIFELLGAMRVVCGMVMRPDELPRDPHLVERGAFLTQPAGADGECLTVPGPGFRIAGEPPEPPPLPNAGTDVDAVLAHSDPITESTTPAGGGGAMTARRPLEHIRIVDLTQAWAGAYATQLLADLGADVIKVEARRRPDPWRGGFGASRGLPAYPLDGPGERPYNRSYLANSVNRNKRGITLDLAGPRGRELFLGLVRDADVVAENFTPRVLGNLGLGYEALRAVRPELILLSMPAYGLAGRYSAFPGIGGSVEPMSGNCWLLGEPGGEPQVSGVMYPDAVAGVNGASAVLTALQMRMATGRGCHVEVSQQESMIAITGQFYARGGLEALGRQGNADPTMAPHGIYRCAPGEDGWAWLALAVRDDADWERLLGVVDVAGLRDERFAAAAGRLAARDELDRLIEGWTSARSEADAEAALLAAGVPAARVRRTDAASACPQMTARGFFVEDRHPEAGIHRTAGIAVRLAETPGRVTRPAPRHGEHSREVLARYLGVTDAEYEELVATGITGEGPPADAQPVTAGASY
jgi:crotonobetainyl-CoA:carnitine CoA-transferase CaiB-like acyl-CoA transferase